MVRVGFACLSISVVLFGCSGEPKNDVANSSGSTTTDSSTSTNAAPAPQGEVKVSVVFLPPGTKLENESPVAPGTHGAPTTAVACGMVRGSLGIPVQAFRLSDGRIVRLATRKSPGGLPGAEKPTHSAAASKEPAQPIRVVAHPSMQRLPIEKLSSSPPWFLQGAMAYYHPSYGKAPNDGYIDVTVDQDMALYVGVQYDTKYPPGQAAPDPETVLDYREMNRDGWVDVGKLAGLMKQDAQRDLFWKRFSKGEKFRFRTGVYQTPLVITAATLDSNPLDRLPDQTMSAPQARRTMKSKLEHLLRSRKFDELEVIVAKYRRDMPYDRDGEQLLLTFYEATTPLMGTVADREELLKLLEEWRAAKPLSAAAHYAQIDFWNEYAWMARDRGADMSELAFRRQRDRYRNARSLLLAAGRLVERDAYYFHLQGESVLFHGGVDDRIEDLEAVMDDSLKFDPDFMYPLTEGARYFRPRWHGGDMEKYAARCADRTKQRHGDSVYTLCAISEANVDGLETAKGYGFDWERLKRGFADLRKRFPDSIEYEEWNCWFAVKYEDWNAANAAFDQLERRPDGSYDPVLKTLKWQHTKQLKAAR